MQAELVVVGTELLLGEIVDTNAQWLAARLAEVGVDLYFKTTVGDNWTRMAWVLAQALGRADVVIVSGGLGPTMDDLTRSVIAGVTGRPLVQLPEAAEHVKLILRGRGRPMGESLMRQTWFPAGAQPIPNERGTALGILLEMGPKMIVALPGVPSEMKSMVEKDVLPMLVARQGVRVTCSRVLRFWGLGESSLEDLVRDLIAEQTNPTIAPYARTGESRLRLTARAGSTDEAMALIEPVEQEIRRRTGSYLYGVDDCSLEKTVGELLWTKRATLATAESCTGGLMAHRITNVPGSSVYFLRGWVTYSNEAKRQDLGVNADLLNTCGAVSAQVAEAMARGAQARALSTYAVSTTGIAGPGGGSERKPVGLVYVAVAGPGDQARVEEFRSSGHREDIKERSVSAALNLLRQCLQEHGEN